MKTSQEINNKNKFILILFSIDEKTFNKLIIKIKIKLILYTFSIDEKTFNKLIIKIKLILYTFFY
jgi:hypothetical protein